MTDEEWKTVRGCFIALLIVTLMWGLAGLAGYIGTVIGDWLT